MLPTQLSLLDLLNPEEELARTLCRERIEAMPFYRKLPPRRRARAVARDVDRQWRSMLEQARRRLADCGAQP